MSRQIISFIQDHYQLVFFGQYLLSSDSHFDLIHTKFLTRILAHYSTRVIMEPNINQVPNLNAITKSHKLNLNDKRFLLIYKWRGWLLMVFKQALCIKYCIVPLCRYSHSPSARFWVENQYLLIFIWVRYRFMSFYSTLNFTDGLKR